MIPETPAAVVEELGAAAAGTTDREDLDRMLADDEDMEARRQAISRRHTVDTGPVMLALSRMAALTDQMAIEVRFIRNHIEGAR